MELFVVSSTLLLIIICIIGRKLWKYANLLDKKFEEYGAKEKQRIELKIINEKRKLEELLLQQEKEEEILSKRKNSISEIIEQLESRREAEIRHKEELIDKTLKQHFLTTYKQYNEDLMRNLESIQLRAQNELSIEEAKYLTQLEEQEKELNTLLLEVEDWRKRRAAINEDLRKQTIEEEWELTHSLCLKDTELEDIQMLIGVAEKFNKKDTLYKLIWSEYILKHFNDMILKQFGGKIPNNVIYCIEHKDTHKKYIGKTVAEVSKRWTEHIKTSLNIGSVSRTKIHDALWGNWNNFLFIVVEVVDSHVSITEREKWYINFYETNTYGYNIKSGG